MFSITNKRRGSQVADIEASHSTVLGFDADGGGFPNSMVSDNTFQVFLIFWDNGYITTQFYSEY